MGGEESRSQKHKSSKSFVIREVPIQRTNGFPEMEKAMMMDYDTPELVVFLQEDRAASAKEKSAMEDCECYEGTTETMSSSSSSVSKASDSACRNPCINKSGFRSNMLTMMVEGDHPTEGGEEEGEVVTLFDKKHQEWCSCSMGTSATRCGSVSASHGSSDSISSTHSFTFPILQREWSGSPVRMAEPHTNSQSRRIRWRNILCPCCKC